MVNLIMFKHAFGDFRMANVIYANRGQDFYADIACGQLLAQCVEKVLKGYLEFTDVNLRYTEPLKELIEYTENSDSKCIITEWLKSNSFALAQCKYLACYPSKSYPDPQFISHALVRVEEFLKLNGVMDRYLSEVTGEVKLSLRKNMPRNIVIEEPLCWNIIYKLYT